MRPRYFLFLALLLLSITLRAQRFDYDRAWRRIDSLLTQKGLPASALEEVGRLSEQARRDGNDAQQVKAIVYQLQLQPQVREEKPLASALALERQLATTREPAAALLRSLLAGTYWRYLQNHRWQYYGRTQTTGFQKDDPATWTLQDFHEKISSLYLGSLAPAALLKQTPVGGYEALLRKGNARALRPTLYDLLAQEALDYFKTGERDLARPADAFEISSADAFGTPAVFAAARFPSPDTLSLQRRALQLYQQLTLFHLADKNEEALLDLSLDRLEFVYANSVHPEKEQLYEQALRQWLNQAGRPGARARAAYLLARFYSEHGNRYQPLGDTAYRFGKNRAVAVLQEVVRDSSVKGEGWVNSYNLLQELLRPTFSFETESVNIPGKPFRALVRYTNLDRLYFRVVPATVALKNAQTNYRGDQDFWKDVSRAAAVRSWQQPLPATADHQQHSAEVKVDALPAGEYFLLASSGAAFGDPQQVLGAQLVYISNISFVNRGNRYFVLHRETGQPLAGATVQTWEQQWDAGAERNRLEAAERYKTDEHGYFEIRGGNERRSKPYLLDISQGKDRLFMNAIQYAAYFDNTGANEARNRVFFFTDRGLYRPGQTLFFKGIAFRQNGRGSEVQRSLSTMIYLRNVNYQVVDSMQVTTNEWGSFQGRFTLPATGLAGLFTLSDKNNAGSAAFAVEEYKRPRFAVRFLPVEKSYRVGDSIRVNGKAEAYAGNNLSNAKLVYRVIRTPRFEPWTYKRIGFAPGRPMEIAHGEAATDANGNFSIRFAAIPDRSVDSSFNPLFDYQVMADVTDLNGETRSANTRLSAGYRSLFIRLDLPARISTDSLKRLPVRVENSNGLPQAARLAVRFTRLLPEQRLIRPRYWQRPDQFVMSRDSFLRYFPTDEYRDELDPTSWPKGETAWQGTDSLLPGGYWPLNQKLPPGFYAVTVETRDKDGRVITAEGTVEVTDAQGTPLRPDYLRVLAPAGTTEPGATDSVWTQVSPPAFLVSELQKSSGSRFDFSSPGTDAQSARRLFTYPITEADRGGFGLNYFLVRDNRLFSEGVLVNVPWSNKELQVRFDSYRDKTLPGADETWSLQISGSKGEKLAAEVLAAAYDASLDQFRPFQWRRPDLWPLFYSFMPWNGQTNFVAVHAGVVEPPVPYRSFTKEYDRFIFDEGHTLVPAYFSRNMQVQAAPAISVRGASTAAGLQGKVAGIEAAKDGNGFDEVVVTGAGQQRDTSGEARSAADPVTPRRNFNETAFFFPELRTDSAGRVAFTFRVPEALTRWKLQALAHTTAGAFGMGTREFVTQKELMVQPNAPRFLRQGDKIELAVKVVNLTDKEQTGQVQLELFDAATNQPVDGWFLNTFPNQYFTVAAGGSEAVKFPVQVPFQFVSTLRWRVTARAGDRSDGEENILPVVSNKLLVTETLPLPMRGNGTKTFRFEKLLRSGESETLQHQALTVEYTANPAWYVVQALPYLAEYPYECAEQTWNRYYANTLASYIAGSSPRIRAVFEQWKGKDTAALLSALQKNPELKSALLEETPWVLEARSEAEQKKRIALLFDAVRLAADRSASLARLRSLQNSNGSFSWFKGGPDDRHTTQYIVSGIGRLQKLGIDTKEAEGILANALAYLDRQLKEDHDRLLRSKADKAADNLGAVQVQALYARSFFPARKIPAASQAAYAYYQQQLQRFWVKQSVQLKGMAVLTLFRGGDLKTANDLLRSLKETSLYNEELGRYWNEAAPGRWWWWQRPIETQALLIEAFSEAGKDTATIDQLRTWLLKNKQTNNWSTTKATADACYALLLQGTDWLSAAPEVQISLGPVTAASRESGAEAGTGYFKRTLDGKRVQAAMGTIKVDVRGAGNRPSWGAVYWQYFEDMDKITAAATPLQLQKKLFVEKNTDRGPVLTPVTEGTALQVGTRLRVRIELRVDRDMEYVHLKDLRASALEPVNVLSGYRFQDGLSYYETTRDLSTSFFFHYLRKGTYVFEYPLFVTHTGNFQNGIATIQCLYAPEFNAHSEGVRITVD